MKGQKNKTIKVNYRGKGRAVAGDKPEPEQLADLFDMGAVDPEIVKGFESKGIISYGYGHHTGISDASEHNSLPRKAYYLTKDQYDALPILAFMVFGHNSRGKGVILEVKAKDTPHALEQAGLIRPDCRFNHANVSNT